MKIRMGHLVDLLVVLPLFPAFLMIGVVAGLGLGFVAWWTKWKLCWAMLDKDYVWEGKS